MLIETRMITGIVLDEPLPKDHELARNVLIWQYTRDNKTQQWQLEELGVSRSRLEGLSQRIEGEVTDRFETLREVDCEGNIILRQPEFQRRNIEGQIAAIIPSVDEKFSAAVSAMLDIFAHTSRGRAIFLRCTPADVPSAINATGGVVIRKRSPVIESQVGN